MITCPIALWKQQHPESFAFPGMSYREFNALIQRLCQGIAPISEKILAFVPARTILDVAFFFAAWRMGKAVYPLSFRLPRQAIEKRLLLTGAFFAEPSQFLASSELEMGTIEENSLATLIETSSSEKIVCHLFKSHLSSALACSSALNLNQGDSYCLNLPLCHISGIALMLRTFLSEATLIFPEKWKEATHISMVPTQLFRFIEKNDSLPRLKCLLVGGAPLSKFLYEEALSQSLPVHCSYGMTETASMILLKPPHRPAVTLPHIEMKLSEEGEILVRGISLYENYFGKEKRIPETWFATRDIGRLTNGEIEIVGRKDRQFISGGENIIPEEIEQALLQLHGVIEAHVSAEQDREFGMVPIAELYCKSKIDSAYIQQKLEEILPRYKIPKKMSISTYPLSKSKQTQMVQK